MPAVVGGRKETESSSEDEQEDHPCIRWSGLSRTIPVLLFLPEAVVSKDRNICCVGERYNLAFKIIRTESCLVRGILTNHGFHEVHPNSKDFNLMWTGSHLKPYVLHSLQDFQKVNHFPRSYELTRKDRLYRNIQRMQQTHGFRNFHIIPQTFVLPSEFQRFQSCAAKDGGPWIIKPVASSRGRGIYLVSNPSQVSVDENILVSRYINDPLLIDEFKFDVRLYVLVTSFDPLLIYVYEEGLARFATVKYDQTSTNIKNTFMHLTNYSLNKKSRDYVSCDDPEVEDYGNKWSMSAVLRYLKQEGKDTNVLMRKVEDVIIKAVLSVEQQIAAACRTSIPHRNNCFELYGFDVLIDSNLKPWLLEVNLSPSLSCDAPLDLKIKASMIADMFSLVGFVCQDPQTRQALSDRITLDKNPAGLQARRQRRTPAVTTETEEVRGKASQRDLSLSSEEVRLLRRIKEEYERRGGFIRIFPTADTWELYGAYLQHKTSMNVRLASTLFQEKNGNVQVEAVNGCHVVQYERKLLCLEARRRKLHHLIHRSAVRRKKPGKEFREEEHLIWKRETRSEHRHGEAASSSEAANAMRTVNLLSILQGGWELSKVQARISFSSYLQRVQQRLLAENRSCSTPAWPEKDEDQMELVFRFLRRAAGNLQQDLKVVLPTCQLPVQDRRRILADQLGQFIHCYNKETEHMGRKQEGSEDQRCVDSRVFQDYISNASENDLEEVLTFYTQKKKSATVFLGTKVQAGKKDLHYKTFLEDSGSAPSMAGDNPDSSRSTGKVEGDLKTMESLCVLAADLQVEVTTAKTQRSSSFPRTSGRTSVPASLPLHCPPPPPPPQPPQPPQPQPPSYAQSLAKSHLCPSESSSEPPSYSSALLTSQRAVSTASSGSSFATSGQSGQVLRKTRSSTQSSSRATSSVPANAHIYSQTLSRPPCAEPGVRRTSSRVKSCSVGALRELQVLPSQAQSNQQAFLSVLQRLANKQAARHYAGSAHISLLTQHLIGLNQTNRIQNRIGFSLNHKAAAGQVGPVQVGPVQEGPVQGGPGHSGKDHLSSTGVTLDQPSSLAPPSPDTRGVSSDASTSSHLCSSTSSV
ncbi:tubulin polyglutamylase TTLL5-like isoform X2 [Melanotaenia boesemani]|uniref:tubulin polyglutamylase TTLL5-like isoform X2 n=1 Tax=Melanotaenia boesemani TaxID=1250792 RepID=UPI001C0480E7|nr:tubulin polyglutamylase TTLL5-like isoform X2 [Melanotaenia boesemani]